MPTYSKYQLYEPDLISPRFRQPSIIDAIRHDSQKKIKQQYFLQILGMITIISVVLLVCINIR